MAAYFIASYRITKPVAFASYGPAVVPTILASGCEVIVADYASQAIEGVPGEVTVVLKFASKAAAMAWYDSPEYAAIKHHRIDNSDGIAVIVDQWVAPG